MVTPGFYPIRGGTETIVRNLSIELNKIGVRTDVMTFNMDKKWNPKWKGNAEEVDGVRVFKIAGLKLLPSSYRVNMGVSLIPGNFVDIIKRYDIIHFHEADLSFPFFSLFIKKPKLLHLHGIDANFIKRYHLYRMAFKHVAEYYMTITKEMEKNLIELGISKSRILYLPNAVDVRLFHPDKGKKEEKLLLYLGRITPVKGLHILLKSLRYLQKAVHLVIIGPADQSLNYYKYVVKLAKKENQKGKHKVEYLGVVSTEEAIKFYQRAAIFILPSFWEAFPVVILEALACETPVIATPVGGIPEVIRSFKDGILVPLNNPIKLAEAINYLLEHDNVRIKMGQSGREHVVNNFSVDAIAKKLCNIYEKIIRC
jgi:glycosyltransferase involved in cell wall biosynthesis